MKIEKRFNLISLIILAVFIITTVFFNIIAHHLPEKIDAILFCVTGSIIAMTVALIIIRRYISRRIVQPIKDIHRGSSITITEGDFNNMMDVKTGDELEDISDNFNKMASVLQTRIDMLKTASEKEQHVIRSLAMLTEMMGFITSELKFETILQTFLEMTRSLLKAEYSGIFIFEGEQRELKLFKTALSGENDTSLGCARAMIQTPLGEVIRTLTPLIINELVDELPLNHIAIKNLLAIPLTSTDNRMSALLIMANKDGGFTQDDEDTIFNFAFQAFQALIIHEEIARLAVTDGLTGMNNHRALQERLSDEMDRAGRYFKKLALIMLDIDHFKSFNDIYGHQTGDRVLKDIAKIINNSIRNVDFPARYGGEEFIVILPETGHEDAAAIAERIRLKMFEHPFTAETGEDVKLTISAGIACYPSDATEKKDLIKKADQALYFAKNHGRNRVCTYLETVIGTIKEIPVELDNILKDPSLKGIEVVAKEIDARSNYTKGHSLEVAAYAVMLGKQIRLDQMQVESLRIASILHDIGNMGIPDHILNKPGSLTPEEKSIIQGHPGLAEMVLKKYPHIEDILPAILYHHERFDGKGYPLGLKEEEIPLLARILSVVEAYEAMISPRPYRRRMSKEEAIGELKKEAGSQFDPMVVNAFVNLLRQKKDDSSGQKMPPLTKDTL